MNKKKIETIVRKAISEETGLPVEEIGQNTPFEELGIESVMMISITRILEKSFGELPKTLFFEYNTPEELSTYLLSQENVQEENVLEGIEDEHLAKDNHNVVEQNTEEQIELELNSSKPFEVSNFTKEISGRTSKKSIKKLEKFQDDNEEIAIVGMSGRFADANNIEEYYQNLKNGHDSIREVPGNLWDWKKYWSDKRNLTTGKSYTRWGGFMNDIDKFDPLHFRISNAEAESLDPQERIFLETAEETLEDSGYTAETLKSETVGVFAGVMWGQYQLYGVNDASTGSSYASVANRVSYFFNFKGPSMTIDTMCSSSITGIHLACQSILSGESTVALAGGVNITVHPNKHLYLSKTGFASTDGKCRSFGDGGDGYVPGDGSGAVLLKKLSQAEKDHDNIYGVIKATGINHGGKVRGYTVPNPEAQFELISKTLKKAKVEASDIDYFEMHGTGTSLGDPIEVRSLQKNFRSIDIPKIPIGSVKSNIGHLESAAGIAALEKVILQFQHNEIFPSLHSQILNKNINFEKSPFYVNQELQQWSEKDDHNKNATISAFGAGGSNAFMVVGEYQGNPLDSYKAYQINEKLPFPFSAESKSQLIKLVDSTRNYLQEFKENTHKKFNDIYLNKLQKLYRLTNLSSAILSDSSTIKDLGLSVETVNGLMSEFEMQVNEEQTVSQLKKIILNNLNNKEALDIKKKFIDTSYTLVVGRTNYSNRCIFSCDSYENLLSDMSHMEKYILDGHSKIGELNESDKEYIGRLEKSKNNSALKQLWAKGLNVQAWEYGTTLAHKTSLPTYPFLKERCWVPETAKPVSMTRDASLRDSLLQYATQEYEKQTASEELLSKNIKIMKTSKDGIFVRFNVPMGMDTVWQSMNTVFEALNLVKGEQMTVEFKSNRFSFAYLLLNSDVVTKVILFDRKNIYDDKPRKIENKSIEFFESKNELSKNLANNLIEDAVILMWGKEAGLSEHKNVVNLYGNEISSTVNDVLKYAGNSKNLSLDFSRLQKTNEEIFNDISSYRKEQNRIIQFLSILADKLNGRAKIHSVKIFVNTQKNENSIYLSFLPGVVRSWDKETRKQKIQLIKSTSDKLLYSKDENDTVYQIKDNAVIQQRLRLVDNTNGKTKFANGGIYVLVGGSGTVGRQLSRILIDKYQCTVIWMGRKGISVPNGVVYYRCDITNETEIKETFEKIQQEYPHITGLWNLAMSFSIKRLTDITNKDLALSLDSKLSGTFNILNNVDTINAKSIIMFSSAESYIGNSGWSLYAAASAGMDELVKSYVLTRPILKSRVKIINWGFWKNDQETINKNLRARGIYPITGQEGLEVIAGLNSGSMQQVVAMKIDEKIKQSLEINEDTHIVSVQQPEDQEELSEVSKVSLDLTQVKTIVYKVFAEVLHITPNKLSGNTDIANYGVDSINLVELNRSFKKNMPGFVESVLLDNTTINEIIEDLTKVLKKNKISNNKLSKTVSIPREKNSKTDIIESVLTTFSQVLNIEKSKMDVKTDIANYGVDSIMMVSLANSLKRKFKFFTQDILLNNVTIAEISAEILKIENSGSIQTPTYSISLMEDMESPISEDSFFINYGERYQSRSLKKENTKHLDEIKPSMKLKHYLTKDEHVSIEVFDKGVGDPILLLPAIGLTAPIFVNQFKELSKNHRVICMHMPGYGLSSAPRQLKNNEVATLFVNIFSFLGINNSLDIIASCFGSILGTTIAAKFDSLVRKLVLVGGFYDGQDIESVDETKAVTGSPVEGVANSIGLDFDNLSQYSNKDKSELLKKRDFLLGAACSNPLIAIRYLNELKVISTEQYLRNLKQPLLLVYGTDDSVIPIDRSKEIHTMVKNSTVCEFEEEGHYPYLTSEIRFNKVIEEFLEED